MGFLGMAAGAGRADVIPVSNSRAWPPAILASPGVASARRPTN